MGLRNGCRCLRAAWCVFALLGSMRTAQAYSQFTHLALVDLLWSESIRPLLLHRYPGTKEDALARAHAYAYGGSLIQDVGYYPFGKTFFSDLGHHVRSGDFVVSLLRNAHDVNELAFAIGALSHYVGDSIGHSEAVNPATAETFPELRREFGRVVTFENAPTAHVRTEFGFDVAQVTWQRYAPEAYRRRTGFLVASPLLFRAFRETYGIPAGGVLGPAQSALASYRWSVRGLLPAFLHAEIVLLRRKLPPENRDAAQAEFLAAVSKAEYARSGGGTNEPLGAGAHILALVVRILPKFGKLKILAVKPPTAATEALFEQSLNHAIGRYRELLSQLSQAPERDFELANLNLDTGAAVRPNLSASVDATYAELVSRLVRAGEPVPEVLRRHVLSYYTGMTNRPKELHRLVANMETPGALEGGSR